MASSNDHLPGQGLMGWLGRQLGYVTKAVKTDVVSPSRPTESTLYRSAQVNETPHPADPNVILRRTVIDEAIVKTTPGPEKP